MIEDKTINPRYVALDALIRIDKGEFTHIVIKEVLDKNINASRLDRAFIKKLVNGTCEYRLQMDYILKEFISTDIYDLKPSVRNILRMGVYQMLYMDSVPNSAACNESVKLAEEKKLFALKGFINGVLRNVGRNREKITNFKTAGDVTRVLSVKYSMPLYLVRMWADSYGVRKTVKMLEAFLKDSKVCIRINTAIISPEDCMEVLDNEQIKYSRHPYSEEALIIKSSGNIGAKESFKKGYYQIQDISSQLVCPAAEIKHGMQVLDICAAPGGKTMHAAQLAGADGRVYAHDISEDKIALINSAAHRLGYTNIISGVSDASKFNPDYENKFDVVLADLPCSGLGVIGRKSDIKYRIQMKDIYTLAALQKVFLKNAVRYVKPGGVLMFTTCTVNTIENDDNVKFITDNFNFTLADNLKLPKTTDKVFETAGGTIQIMPGTHDSDGFYMAKLIKGL